MKWMQQVCISRRAPDLALELAMRLARQGHSVVIFHLHDAGGPVARHRFKAAHLARVRFGIYDIHEGDMASALGAAKASGIDFCISLFKALNDGLGGDHPVILNVKLTRVGRELAELADEVASLTDIAIRHGHRVLFVQVTEAQDKLGV
ncbi:hypothetical protein [Deinococcus sp. UYEF24]